MSVGNEAGHHDRAATFSVRLVAAKTPYGCFGAGQLDEEQALVRGGGGFEYRICA